MGVTSFRSEATFLWGDGELASGGNSLSRTLPYTGDYAGQSMTLTPVAPLHVSVTAPDGSQLPGGPAETITFHLPLSGDYVVEILPGMSEQTAHSITVIIPAGATAPAGVLPPTL